MRRKRNISLKLSAPVYYNKMMKCFICSWNLFARCTLIWPLCWSGFFKFHMKSCSNAKNLYCCEVLCKHTPTPPQRESEVYLTGILELLWFYNRKNELKNRGWHQYGKSLEMDCGRWLCPSICIGKQSVKMSSLPIKSQDCKETHFSGGFHSFNVEQFPKNEHWIMLFLVLLTYSNGGHIMWHCRHRMAKDSWKEGQTLLLTSLVKSVKASCYRTPQPSDKLTDYSPKLKTSYY